MLLCDKIEINVKGSVTIYKLKELGYDCVLGDVIVIPIDKLWKKSSLLVDVRCDVCGNEKQIRFADYNINIQKYDIYTCSNKCAVVKNKMTNLEKYGVENVFQSEEIKKKSKETCLEKYGIKNYRNVEKSKKTCLEKYGVEFTFNSEEIKEKSKETCLEKYGVEYSILSDNFKKKTKQTNLNKYGVEHPTQNKKILEKIKQSKKERYGDENYNNREKYKETCLNKYGVDSTNKLEFVKDKVKETNFTKFGYTNNSKSKKCKDKLRKTNLERYGVEYPMQVEIFFNKQQRSAFKIKTYKDTNLIYQGSYELDFLNYCKTNRLINLIERPKPIDYVFETKNRKYYPDYFIDKYNLLIEIKSTYTYNKYIDKNISKKKQCLEMGYNYIVIVDKDYEDFEIMLENIKELTG